MAKPKKESSRTNTGVRGARKTKLSEMDKILMGKGVMATLGGKSKK